MARQKKRQAKQMWKLSWVSKWGSCEEAGLGLGGALGQGLVADQKLKDVGSRRATKEIEGIPLS